MKRPARSTMRRLMIGAAVVSTILGAVGFLYWLWLPWAEPTSAGNHGVSVERRAFLGGTGEFLSWNPNAKILATSSTDFINQDAILWDATTFKARFTLIGHRHHIDSLAWSPDGRNLATGSWDMSVMIWDVPTGTRAAILRKGFNEVIEKVAWSPDGKILATTFGSFQKSTILWDVVGTK
jgi:WD40 repeat protein